MSWSASAAQELLREAFPWGAQVTGGDGSFLSLAYEVVDGGSGPDSVTVRFARGSAYLFERVGRPELEAASSSGTLRCESGAAVRRPEVGDLELLEDPFRDFIGPQVAGETGWIARMRLHQSWWRTFRLRVPFGTGPRPGAGDRFGNMLDEDGDKAGLNFLSPEARDAYDKRLGLTSVGIEPFRTRRHLMSSQALAFNVFGHLSFHPDIASAAFSEVLGDQIIVGSIEIERLSDVLQDRTAFDAFATATTPAGPACFAIETKLTEPFSQKLPDNWTKYTEHELYDPSRWSTSDPAKLGDRRWSQLWRNHMLGLAESTRHGLGKVHLFVVHHPLDPHCEANVEGYRSLLTSPEQVTSLPLDHLVRAIDAVVGDDDSSRRWLEDLRDRYLRLELSDPLCDVPH